MNNPIIDNMDKGISAIAKFIYFAFLDFHDSLLWVALPCCLCVGLYIPVKGCQGLF
jgi:hypothetical protein